MKTNSKTTLHIRLLLVCVTLLGVFGLSQAGAAEPMPEFTNTNPQQWFNSKPLKRADLKGKVVLLDVWTYGCWNCYRSFPWLNSLEEKFPSKDFVIIGIHTPEFGHEKNADNVAEKIKGFKLQNPVMMDNDFGYWKALGNRYWPSFYIIDKQGKIRFTHIGETHSGDRNATQIEKEIRQLLTE